MKNGRDIMNTSDKVWIVQNGKYLTYPKTDHKSSWIFYLFFLLIFEVKFRTIHEKVTING